LETHTLHSNEYTTTNFFPLGLGVEIIKYSALEEAFKNAVSDYDIEHVTPYIYLTNPENFKIEVINVTDDVIFSGLRLTLDNIEDYTLLCSVYDELYDSNNLFGLEEISRLFRQKPWLKQINAKIIQKKHYFTLEDEIDDAIKLMDYNELNRVKKLLIESKK